LFVCVDCSNWHIRALNTAGATGVPMEALARNASAFGDLHARLTLFKTGPLVSAVFALPH
jgi:hypothetical protein